MTAMNSKPGALIPLLAALALAPAAEASSGQRLAITTPANIEPPDARAVLHALLGETPPGSTQPQIQLRVLRPGGSTTVQIDVTGASLPADSAERLRAMFPALRDAQITLTSTDGALLPPLPPNPDQLTTPEQIAAFKQQVEAQLAAEGKTGTVEVRVNTGPDGKRQVKVEVKAQ